jgi:hypothetical protein
MKINYYKLLTITILLIFSGSIYAQNNIESKIKDKLPNNVFLREYEKIPGSKVDSYVGIYIVNPITAEIPNEDGFGQGIYYICPDRTLGQTITGIYHLFLFQDNSVKSDIVIPPAYSENNTDAQELCYYNTDYNLCWHFEDKNNCDRNSESNNSRTNLRKAKLINFKDCTGSGKNHNFVLVGPSEACGWVCYLIAGYNEELNIVEIFDVKSDYGITQWFARFYPNEQGESLIEILCGDHGSEYHIKEFYKFNKTNRRFEFINKIETPCD